MVILRLISTFVRFIMVSVIFIYLFGIMLILMTYHGTISNTTNENTGTPTEAEVSETGSKEIPEDLVPIYKQVGQIYNVPWQYLASIHYNETRFGRTTQPGDPNRKKMLSPVGAQGPAQFMDLTWIGWDWTKDHKGASPKGDIPDNLSVDITDCNLIKKYGGFGTDGDNDGRCDPWNEVDAIHSMAKYLAHHGGSQNIKKAIKAYNHSTSYVSSVMSKASEFGQPVAGVRSSQGFIWPTPNLKEITSPFGIRVHPIKKRIKKHNGVDIAGPNAKGSPVVASQDGVAQVKNDPKGYGNYIVLEHQDGYSTLYGHLDSTVVQPGQIVNKGDEIGKVGNTGGSTGPHLHFEIRKNGNPENPSPFFE